MTEDFTSEARPAAAGSWAILALALALVLVLGSSLFDLIRTNATLTNVDKEQTAALANSHKSEDQLNALARGTQQLADSGNVNAQAVVATLQRNGVHINADGASKGK
jgi:hypothetical protein